MRRAGVPAAAFVALLVALACSDPTTGPARIVWGRHACDHCAMAISDPRYAAQVRVGPREVKRFDDFGCAVLWLDANGGPDRAQEFWAADSRSAEPDAPHWLDARRASFQSGQRTPMAFGWAAVANGDGAATFDAARAAILAHEAERGAARGR